MDMILLRFDLPEKEDPMGNTAILSSTQTELLHSKVRNFLQKQGYRGEFDCKLSKHCVEVIHKVSKVSFAIPFSSLGKSVQKLFQYQNRITEPSHKKEGSSRPQDLTNYLKHTKARQEDISYLATNLQMPFENKKNSFSFGRGIRSLFNLTDLDEASRLEDYIRTKGAYLDVTGSTLTYSSYLALTAGNIMKLVSKTLATGPAEKLVSAGGGISAGASLVLMGASAFRFYHTYRLRNAINEYVENPNLEEKDKYLATLRLIKEQVYITDKEKQGIKERLLRKGLKQNSLEWNQALSEAFSKLSQKKQHRFIEKTGRSSFIETISKVDYLLEKLKNGETSAVTEAKEFVEGLLQANKQRLTYHGLLFTSFFLGFIATVLSLVSLPISGYLIAALNLISIMIYLIGAISNKLTQRREQAFIQSSWQPILTANELEEKQSLLLEELEKIEKRKEQISVNQYQENIQTWRKRVSKYFEELFNSSVNEPSKVEISLP